jgi:hypothetical protein
VIYFAWLTKRMVIKIGHSIQPLDRIESLTFHYRQPLTLIGLMEGGAAEEKAIHTRFADYRYYTRGHWATELFEPHPSLLGFIDTLGFPGLSARREWPDRLRDVRLHGASIVSLTWSAPEWMYLPLAKGGTYREVPFGPRENGCPTPPPPRVTP